MPPKKTRAKGAASSLDDDDALLAAAVSAVALEAGSGTSAAKTVVSGRDANSVGPAAKLAAASRAIDDGQLRQAFTMLDHPSLRDLASAKALRIWAACRGGDTGALDAARDLAVSSANSATRRGNSRRRQFSHPYGSSFYHPLSSKISRFHLQRSKPTDMAVLRPLLQVFRQCGEPALALSALEAAATQAPESEEVSRQLCYAYLHGEDYKKMQAVSAKPVVETESFAVPNSSCNRVQRKIHRRQNCLDNPLLFCRRPCAC